MWNVQMYDSYSVSLLKRALHYLKPFLKDIIFVLVCIFISSVLNLLLPLINKIIVDQGLVAQDLNVVIQYSLLTLVIILAVEGSNLLQTKFYSKINAKYQFSLFYRACSKMLRFKIDYFTYHNSGEIINNLSSDVSNVSKISDKTTFLIIDQVFKMISGIIGLSILSWKLMVFVILIVPLKYILVKKLSAYRKETIKDYLEQNRVFYSWFGDLISGIKEIKLFVLQRMRMRQFVAGQRKILRSNIRLAYSDQFNQIGEEILYQILNSLLYIVGAIFIINRELTVGGLLSFITYSTYVTQPLSAIINLRYNYASFMPSAKRLFDFLDEESEESPKLLLDKNVKIPDKIQGHIVFDNVSFSYESSRKIFENVNLEIQPGEKIAIVGKNGAGKTTLLNLLLRFYTPDSGRITLDSIDINNINLSKYRKCFSVVSQDPHLFNTTIQNNIDLTNSHSRGEIEQACLKSGAKAFVENLPQKDQTIVGQNGTHLSGGEKQKIAVSRVFLRDSPIIIFDEATSNFDAFSDDYLNKMIFTELSDKTVIVITHKNSILKYMDKVFRVEEGRIYQENSVF
jgi:ATP-binding cassette subfamily B protein